MGTVNFSKNNNEKNTFLKKIFGSMHDGSVELILIVLFFMLVFVSFPIACHVEKTSNNKYKENPVQYIIDNDYISKDAKNVVKIGENIFKYEINGEFIVVDLTEAMRQRRNQKENELRDLREYP